MNNATLDNIRNMFHIAESRADPKGLRDHAVLRLLYELSLTNRVLAHLNYEDIDLDTGIIQVMERGRKGIKRRTITRGACKALDAWLHIRGYEPGPLFTNFDRAGKGSGHLTEPAISYIKHHYGKAVGIHLDSRANGPKVSPRKQIERNLYSIMLTESKKKGLKSDLPFDRFLELIHRPCLYCGKENSNNYKYPYKYGTTQYRYNGIDRLDSSLGYTVDNCVPCCGTCNKMKLRLSKDDFLTHIEDIHKHQKTGCQPS